ncbi:hypothetical protein GCM10029964_034890 [Kibdelosporangium lantanae]
MAQWWEDYPSSGPIKVEGGIKARSVRGKIANTWWSQRFIAVLEDLRLGGRLNRGKNYARTGQVMSLDIAPGKVLAKVQGSRPKPYDVKLICRPLTDEQWVTVTDRLAGQALYAAKLLAGEMPPEIEEIFAGLDIPLFPAAARDLPMHCSCPDWAVPCKHVAAVCFLLAERFDQDPFLILEWRGRSKKDIMARLRRDRPATATGPGLEEELDDFFTAGPLPADVEPADTEPVLLRVDTPAVDVMPELTRMYQQFVR